MSRRYNITPTTRKITIHTLDLVDRGKWIEPDYKAPFMTLNLTSDEPVFTSLGWNGIASVTVNLNWLREHGEAADDEGVIRNLENYYKRYALAKDIAEVVEAESDAEAALAWFNENEPKQFKKVDTVPHEAVALDDSSRRYSIEFSSVYRYRTGKNKAGQQIVQQEYFGMASDAPDAVKRVLNYS